MGGWIGWTLAGLIDRSELWLEFIGCRGRMEGRKSSSESSKFDERQTLSESSDPNFGLRLKVSIHATSFTWWKTSKSLKFKAQFRVKFKTSEFRFNLHVINAQGSGSRPCRQVLTVIASALVFYGREKCLKLDKQTPSSFFDWLPEIFTIDMSL